MMPSSCAWACVALLFEIGLLLARGFDRILGLVQLIDKTLGRGVVFQRFQIFAIAVFVVGERLLLLGVLIDLAIHIGERGLCIDGRLQRLGQRR